MRILHVVNSLDPDQGGPPAVVLRITASLAALGHTVSVLSNASNASQDAIQHSIDAVPGSDRVAFHEVPGDGLAEHLFAKRATQSIESILQDIDFVHVHGVWRPLLLRTIRVAQQQKIPYAVTPHVMLSPWSLKQKEIKKKFGLVFGWRAALAKARFIHALNAAEKHAVEQLCLATPIVIVPNGVFAEEFSRLPAKGTFYAKHPELNDQPYIVFLSRLHHQKGVDHLIRGFSLIAKEHADVRLVVAGPDYGDGEMAKALIAAHSLNDRVHLAGPIYGAEKFAALVDAQCFFLPSRQEGFSMAILEAMACGLPVVLSENCNFPEVATERAGLVVELNDKALAEALRCVINDAQLRAEMGASARRMVLSGYTWPVIAEQMGAHYSGADAHRPRRHT